jgi:hypothetical protein
MARIHNSEAIKRILDDAGIQTSRDETPQELARKVVPVLISNPERRINVASSGARGSTGSATVYTIPDDKDFFLTTAMLSYTADAVCDGTLYELTVPLATGETVSLISLPKQTTTAGFDHEVLALSKPIKLLRGGTISATHTFTAGASSVRGNITGFTTTPDN